MKYTEQNAAPLQPAHWIFYVYCMRSHKKKNKTVVIQLLQLPEWKL